MHVWAAQMLQVRDWRTYQPPFEGFQPSWWRRKPKCAEMPLPLAFKSHLFFPPILSILDTPSAAQNAFTFFFFQWRLKKLNVGCLVQSYPLCFSGSHSNHLYTTFYMYIIAYIHIYTRRRIRKRTYNIKESKSLHPYTKYNHQGQFTHTHAYMPISTFPYHTTYVWFIKLHIHYVYHFNVYI